MGVEMKCTDGADRGSACVLSVRRSAAFPAILMEATGRRKAYRPSVRSIARAASNDGQASDAWRAREGQEQWRIGVQLLFWAWIGSFAAHLTSTTEYSGISRPRPRDTL